MPFEFIKTPIDDVMLIQPRLFIDDRGFFTETYKQSNFEKAGICATFLQDNHSYSIKGVLRGLHFQYTPYEQGKLVRCIKGAISEEAHVIYKVSNAEYAPEYDGGIRWGDPDINITWSLRDNGINKPILSPKDDELPFLKDIINKL